MVLLALGLTGYSVIEVKTEKDCVPAFPSLCTQDLGLTEMTDKNQSPSLLPAGCPSPVLVSHAHLRS